MLENYRTTLDRALRADRGVLVELFVELVVRYRRPIEDTSSHCLVPKRSKHLEHSEVTFMDSRCVRVLAFRYQGGGGRMAPSDASRDVGVSVAACRLEDRFDFMPKDHLELPPSYSAAEHPSQLDV